MGEAAWSFSAGRQRIPDVVVITLSLVHLRLTGVVALRMALRERLSQD